MKIAIPDTRLGISCREFDDFAIGVSGFRFTLFCFESCLERQSGERGRAEDARHGCPTGVQNKADSTR
jgi:hypothetical protein